MSSRKSFASISLALLCTSVFASVSNRPAVDQTSLEKGLIHWWKFNGNGMDSAGDLDVNPIGPIDYVPAVMGYGIDMDGVSTGINIQTPRDLAFDNSFTISAWALLRTLPANGKMWSSIIFNGDDRPGLDPYALQVNPSGKIAFLTTGEKNNLSEIQFPMPLRKFVLVTGTYDKKTGSQRLYLNGQLVGSNSEQFSLTPVVPLVEGQHAGVGIGTNNGYPHSRYNFGWDGIINDLRVYNRPLTITEVQALYKLGTVGKYPTPLTGRSE